VVIYSDRNTLPLIVTYFENSYILSEILRKEKKQEIKSESRTLGKKKYEHGNSTRKAKHRIQWCGHLLQEDSEPSAF
jgi:hypothetical protein